MGSLYKSASRTTFSLTKSSNFYHIELKNRVLTCRHREKVDNQYTHKLTYFFIVGSFWDHIICDLEVGKKVDYLSLIFQLLLYIACMHAFLFKLRSKAICKIVVCFPLFPSIVVLFV